MSMRVSFIIPYHPSRLDNLNQTIYFLEKREPSLLTEELVLVSNTTAPSLSSRFANAKSIELKLKNYSRTTMLNRAVKDCTGIIIVLLDSDRILPEDYFTRITNSIQSGEVVTTERLYNLAHPYTNEEIEKGEVARYPDFRVTDNRMRRKNLFAGNTVMYKDDYWKIDGFDEKYIGYGFADTDMTMKAHVHLKPIYLQEDEHHLWHEKSILWNDKPMPNDHFKVLTAINGLRYCKKWKLSPDEGLSQLLKEIREIPESLRLLWNTIPKDFL